MEVTSMRPAVDASPYDTSMADALPHDESSGGRMCCLRSSSVVAKRVPLAHSNLN